MPTATAPDALRLHRSLGKPAPRSALDSSHLPLDRLFCLVHSTRLVAVPTGMPNSWLNTRSVCLKSSPRCFSRCRNAGAHKDWATIDYHVWRIIEVLVVLAGSFSCRVRSSVVTTHNFCSRSYRQIDSKVRARPVGLKSSTKCFSVMSNGGRRYAQSPPTNQRSIGYPSCPFDSTSFGLLPALICSW